MSKEDGRTISRYKCSRILRYCIRSKFRHVKHASITIDPHIPTRCISLSDTSSGEQRQPWLARRLYISADPDKSVKDKPYGFRGSLANSGPASQWNPK